MSPLLVKTYQKNSQNTANLLAHHWSCLYPSTWQHWLNKKFNLFGFQRCFGKCRVGITLSSFQHYMKCVFLALELRTNFSGISQLKLSVWKIISETLRKAEGNGDGASCEPLPMSHVDCCFYPRCQKEKQEKANTMQPPSRICKYKSSYNSSSDPRASSCWRGEAFRLSDEI